MKYYLLITCIFDVKNDEINVSVSIKWHETLKINS
ncbi:hypothetical protein OKW21_002472 [Catalinimonas alkaloidigena]|nr:hypothetical protein [Catalinimonas alkaloidigena]